MVERGGTGIHAATVALIHAHHVHAPGNAFGRDSHHVIRVARTFQAVQNDDS